MTKLFLEALRYRRGAVFCKGDEGQGTMRGKKPRACALGANPLARRAATSRNKIKSLWLFLLFLVGDEGLEPPTFSV